jgi:hypothetical protein
LVQLLESLSQLEHPLARRQDYRRGPLQIGILPPDNSCPRSSTPQPRGWRSLWSHLFAVAAVSPVGWTSTREKLRRCSLALASSSSVLPDSRWASAAWMQDRPS